MLNLEITQFIVFGTILAGVNELLVRARARDWWVVTTILTGALLGAIFGATHYYPGVDVPTGVAIAFGASGLLKGLSVFGNKSVAAPSADTVVQK